MNRGENITTRTHKLSAPLTKEHYTADAAIVWCFDDRFWPALREYRNANGLKRIDRIPIAGGAKSLSSPERETDRGFVIDQILKSLKLHHTKKIVLMTHSDCGAYGGLSRFGGDAKAEMEFQKKELQKAKMALEQIPELAGIPIDIIFVDFEAVHHFESTA